MSLNTETKISDIKEDNRFNLINEKDRLISTSLTSLILPASKLSSTFGAVWNIVNIIQGIGILGIPYAIMNSGWIGLVIIIIAACICCSTGKMIVDCLYETVDNKNSTTRINNDYSDIGAKVWPRFGHMFVVSLSLIEMFGASTLYIILLGTSSYTLINKITNELTEQHWFLIGASSIIFLLFIKHMSVISWFSFTAVVGLFGTTIAIISYCFTKYMDINLKNLSNISITKLPVSTGIIVFSYCAHPVLPTIEGSMKYPGSFNRVMNISFGVATITKLLFGIIPVSVFGNQIFQSISENIMFSDLEFFICAKIFIIINVFFSMPLVIYIILDRIDQSIRPHFHPILWTSGKFRFLWLLPTRIITIFSILLTALIVPYFALVMGFIGSFTGTCLTFILPCWFSLVLHKNELNIIQKLYRICVIIIGIFIGFMGMIYSAIQMHALYITP